MQADAFVYVLEKICQSPIEANDSFFILQARRAEKVIDRINPGKTHREVVRHSVLANVFRIDETFAEVSQQPVAFCAHQHSRKEKRMLWGSEGVRKGPAEASEVCLVAALVPIGEQVVIARLRQLPLAVGKCFRLSFRIPGLDPVRVVVHVVEAGLEIAGIGREPVCCASLARHGHGAAIFAADAEELGLTRLADRQRVRQGWCQNACRRATIGGGAQLRRVDLAPFCGIAAGWQNGRLRILDVVTQGIRFGLVPDVADHAVYGRCSAGGQGGVTNDGLGVGVQVAGVAENRAALEQVVETSLAKVLPIAMQEIGAEAINRDLQYQSRPLCRRSRVSSGKCRRHREQAEHNADGDERLKPEHMQNSQVAAPTLMTVERVHHQKIDRESTRMASRLGSA